MILNKTVGNGSCHRLSLHATRSEVSAFCSKCSHLSCCPEVWSFTHVYAWTKAHFYWQEFSHSIPWALRKLSIIGSVKHRVQLFNQRRYMHELKLNQSSYSCRRRGKQVVWYLQAKDIFCRFLFLVCWEVFLYSLLPVKGICCNNILNKSPNKIPNKENLMVHGDSMNKQSFSSLPHGSVAKTT